MPARTGAEEYFARQLADSEYRRAYKKSRGRIRRIDELVRTIDAERSRQGLSKAALARSAGLPPVAVRRLFTMDSPNPTAATLMALAEALDLEVLAVRKQPSKKATAAKKAAPRRPVKVSA